MFDEALIAAARISKAWPFEEAMKLVERYPEGKPAGEAVLFETGYGPSGLPHIGTFQEVLRTTLVRNAYEIVSAREGRPMPTRLIAFSDDMDGLRKVPDNVPRQDMLAKHIGQPLSRIPDPFGTHESFAHHNNAHLRDFLDRFGFDYEPVSASERYNSGAFDPALKQVLRHYGSIMNVMLPTLREERRRTYSPVLPISPTSGVVLQVPVEVLDAEAGLVRFEDPTAGGKTIEHCILGGRSKLQWKVDWAMRWYALGVDYEMAGKDHTEGVEQSGKIARLLGGRKPVGLIYELFLDAQGEKISKSKGNGLSIEDWLTYGSEESLGQFIYASPRRAKQIHMGVIGRAIDEYWQARATIPAQDLEMQLGNPAWHLLKAARKPGGAGDSLPVSYALLLNLVAVLGAGSTRDQVWSYLRKYEPDADPARHPDLDLLVGKALAYNRDFVAPTLHRRAAGVQEAAALRRLDAELAALPEDTAADDIQARIYEIGKDPSFGFESLRRWFGTLYETLLGSPQGPRMGNFIALYGVGNTRRLIAEALEREREPELS